MRQNQRRAYLVIIVLLGAWSMALQAAAPRPYDITMTAPPMTPSATASGSTTPTRTHAPPTPTPTAAPARANADWRIQTVYRDGVYMVRVPPGCFQMGMAEAGADQWLQDVIGAFGDDPLWHAIYARLTPQHEVCFESTFLLDRTEVTQAQFDDFGGVARERPSHRGDEYPVEAITWSEARAFCDLRGARLPTEAEWEYAARGPDGLAYPWGDDFSPELAVWEGNASGETAEVGSKPDGASWVGALDMSGNVWEWTSTAYDDTDKSGRFPYPYDASDGREDPDLDGVLRVVRGGSYFFLDQSFLRAAVRDGNAPGTRATVIGFRCARDD